MMSKKRNTTTKMYNKSNEINKTTMMSNKDLSEPPVEAKPKSDWQNPNRVEEKNTRGYKHLNQKVMIAMIAMMVMMVMMMMVNPYHAF